MWSRGKTGQDHRKAALLPGTKKATLQYYHLAQKSLIKSGPSGHQIEPGRNRIPSDE